MMKLFAAALAVTFLPASAAFGAEAAAGLPWYMRLELWIAGVGVTGLGYFFREVIKFALSLVRPWILSRLQDWKHYRIVKTGYEIMVRRFHAHTVRLKEKSENGKLTREQITELNKGFRDELVEELALKGIDVIKEKGSGWIDELCELLLARVKSDQVKAALFPLSDLASAPLPDIMPVPPAVTAADFGSTTAGAVRKSVSVM